MEEKVGRGGDFGGQVSPELLVASLAGAIQYGSSFCVHVISNGVIDPVKSSILKKALRFKVESRTDYVAI
jgi:hypothetical protein